MAIATKIDELHESRAELPRPHMGASQLGHHCDRWLWLKFRWAVVEKFPGRIIRLFRRGFLEERQILQDLAGIGANIVDSVDGQQIQVGFGSHVSGSLDAIIEGGLPGHENTRMIAELKTHNLKSFNDLKKKGVLKAKPLHHVQMQAYMHGVKIHKALYFAVCKDNDEIYIEIIDYSSAIALEAIKRGRSIATANRLPEPASKNPTWYQCKMCAGHDFCHVGKTTKEVNCRTCAHSTADKDSTWVCEKYPGAPIPLDYQRTGCDSHAIHPDLVPWELQEGPDRWQAVYVIDGKKVANGLKGPGVFSSRELLNNPLVSEIVDSPAVASLRAKFGATLVNIKRI